MIPIFQSFPPNARLWVYAANRPINLEEHEYISARLSNFIEEWQTHGTKLKADFALLHRRFILIAVDESATGASGCSIDACVREIQAIGKDLDLDFFDRMRVVYRDESNNLVVSCTVNELKELIENHDFPNDTPVFNTSITSLHELQTAWEIPAHESWIKRYLLKTNA